MRDIALQALDAAKTFGAAYADVRVLESRDRHITTKNGKVGQIGSAETTGAGIRVIANGCWGFAASDDLTKTGIERAAKLAVAIARSGSLAKKADVRLAPEDSYQATWISACEIDPFSIPVDEQVSLLLASMQH